MGDGLGEAMGKAYLQSQIDRLARPTPGPGVGASLDALIVAVGEVNRHSASLRALGVRAQLSVNGPDYGDRLSLALDHTSLVDGAADG